MESVDRFKKVVDLLAFIAGEDNVYSPLDKLVRASDRETVYVALYEALRYIAPDIRKCRELLKATEQSKVTEQSGSQKTTEQPDKRRCEKLLEIVEDFESIEGLIKEVSEGRISIAKKIALQALSQALKRR